AKARSKDRTSSRSSILERCVVLIWVETAQPVSNTKRHKIRIRDGVFSMLTSQSQHDPPQLRRLPVWLRIMPIFLFAALFLLHLRTGPRRFHLRLFSKRRCRTFSRLLPMSYPDCTHEASWLTQRSLDRGPFDRRFHLDRQ